MTGSDVINVLDEWTKMGLKSVKRPLRSHTSNTAYFPPSLYLKAVETNGLLIETKQIEIQLQ